MIEPQEVAAFVWEALKNDAQFSTAVGGRIYRDQVPQAAALPAAIVSLVSGADSNTLGGQRVFDTTLVDVHLIGAGASYAAINPAGHRADAVLQGLSGSRGGVRIVKLRRDQPQAYVETDAGTTYTHLVQTYRTEAHVVIVS